LVLHRELGPESAKTGEGQIQGEPPPTDPFVTRIVAVLGGRAAKDRAIPELVDRWRGILAVHLIDQAIGMCERADKPPRTVAYFERALATTAAQNEVDVPPIPTASAGA
jgi:hypothetical protein